MLVVYAKTNAEPDRKASPPPDEKDMPGFSIGQKIDKMGMRGSPRANWCSTIASSRRERHGPLNGGVKVLMSGLDYERVV
ncbi:MAG: hypothetical protein QM681_09870 [Novosphingobium sp.]